MERDTQELLKQATLRVQQAQHFTEDEDLAVAIAVVIGNRLRDIVEAIERLRQEIHDHR